MAWCARIVAVLDMERLKLLGCDITASSRTEAVRAVMERLRAGSGGYVCFANVHTVVTSNLDGATREALNGSFMTVTDGRPIFWLARCFSKGNCEQIPGPDFLPLMVREGSKDGLRHFFLGGRAEVLEKLVGRLKALVPDIEIAGYESPPFRPLNKEETEEMLGRIRAGRADIVWIGLGAPKQEHWMHRHAESLKPAILMGVGAAFDFHAGVIKRAPAIFSGLGLEWFYRLCQEPRRLWRRYLVTNSVFIYLVMKDILRRVQSRT